MLTSATASFRPLDSRDWASYAGRIEERRDVERTPHQLRHMDEPYTEGGSPDECRRRQIHEATRDLCAR